MFKINVTSQFSAAHKLIDYDGKCSNLHGHNWTVRVGIYCEKTNEIGITIDFTKVKKHLSDLIEEFDHKFLNELDCFHGMNPTSENIARVMYKDFSENLKEEGCKLADVEIWESDKSSIIYTEEI
ncbi:MAG: 6-carboxytetrahydropterin synthase QueD [Candidatus Cloacimonetes bacterium]|nr:6-carboxytetrahydropterin synthase QueD [Candidatus Cloacimonadota bacterium]